MSRVVLITGASSGIGYATALAFARRGYHVAGTARRADKLAELQREILQLPAPHGDFLAIQADVRSDMDRAVRETLGRFGRLDILIANAGLGQRGGIVDSAWEDIETVLQTNINGVLHSVRAAVPVMRAGGQIAIVSSIVYNMVSPYAATYAASKAAVSSLAQSLRLELEERGIGVIDLLVGRTETEFNEKRLGKSGRSGGGLPIMSAIEVAEGIVQAVERGRKRVIFRWLDRLIVIANVLIPNWIGRRALRQYK
ncbi:MAG: SDR family NAD(P)-dependent oxidoreductase [Anaerolineae bacterium]|nr:SDR family NAD(P)-dependent oxidoreductase [Anaerolineae bacterium]